MVHRKACRYFKQVVLKMFNVKRNAVTKRNVWQGKNIAFNVLGLYEGKELEVQMLVLFQMFNKIPKLKLITNAFLS
jgi:hypothetical protein